MLFWVGVHACGLFSISIVLRSRSVLCCNSLANVFNKPTKHRIDTTQNCRSTSSSLWASPQESACKSVHLLATPTQRCHFMAAGNSHTGEGFEFVWPSLLIRVGNHVFILCSDSFYLVMHPAGSFSVLQRWTKCFHVQMAQMPTTVSIAELVEPKNRHLSELMEGPNSPISNIQLSSDVFHIKLWQMMKQATILASGIKLSGKQNNNNNHVGTHEGTKHCRSEWTRVM